MGSRESTARAWRVQVTDPNRRGLLGQEASGADVGGESHAPIIRGKYVISTEHAAVATSGECAATEAST
jgi:hypothetical protein